MVEIEKKLDSGKHNPRDIKTRLAREITAIYHGEAAAVAAEADFKETFANKGLPKDVETVRVKVGENLYDVLRSQGLVDSKTVWRRLVKEGAVENIEKGEKITSPDEIVSGDATLKIGKRRFLRIEIL